MIHLPASVALAIAAVISFLQGLLFVPEYRFFYVTLFCQLNKKGQDETRKTTIRKRKQRASNISFFCEIVALLSTSFTLLVPYDLYFRLVVPPAKVNTVWFSFYFLGFVVFRIRQQWLLTKEKAQEPIFVDFSLRDSKDRLILSSFWTLLDLERQLINMDRGRVLNVYGHVEGSRKNILVATGMLDYDEAEHRWVLELKSQPQDQVREAG